MTTDHGTHAYRPNRNHRHLTVPKDFKDPNIPGVFYRPEKSPYAAYDIDGKTVLRNPDDIHKIPPFANVEVFPKHTTWFKSQNPAYVHEHWASSSSTSSVFPDFDGARVGTQTAFAGNITKPLPHRQFNSMF